MMCGQRCVQEADGYTMLDDTVSADHTRGGKIDYVSLGGITVSRGWLETKYAGTV